MTQPLGNTGNRDTGKKKQGGVGMTKTVDRNHGNMKFSAVTFKHIIDSGIVHFSLYEYRLVFRQVSEQGGELDNQLPIQLDAPDGGAVLCGLKSTSFFVIPSLVDRDGLLRKVEVGGGQCQRFREAETGFCNQKNQPIPIQPFFQIQIRQELMQFKLIQIFTFL